MSESHTRSMDCAPWNGGEVWPVPVECFIGGMNTGDTHLMFGGGGHNMLPPHFRHPRFQPPHLAHLPSGINVSIPNHSLVESNQVDHSNGPDANGPINDVLDESDEASEDEDDEEDDDVEDEVPVAMTHQMTHQDPLSQCQQEELQPQPMMAIDNSQCVKGGMSNRLIPMPTIPTIVPSIPSIEEDFATNSNGPNSVNVSNTNTVSPPLSIADNQANNNDPNTGFSVYGKMYFEGRVVLHLKQWTDSNGGIGFSMSNGFSSCSEQQHQKSHFHGCAVCRLKSPPSQENHRSQKEAHRHTVKGVLFTFEDCIIVELYPEQLPSLPNIANPNLSDQSSKTVPPPPPPVQNNKDHPMPISAYMTPSIPQNPVEHQQQKRIMHHNQTQQSQQLQQQQHMDMNALSSSNSANQQASEKHQHHPPHHHHHHHHHHHQQQSHQEENWWEGFESEEDLKRVDGEQEEDEQNPNNSEQDNNNSCCRSIMNLKMSHQGASNDFQPQQSHSSSSSTSSTSTTNTTITTNNNNNTSNSNNNTNNSKSKCANCSESFLTNTEQSHDVCGTDNVSSLEINNITADSNVKTPIIQELKETVTLHLSEEDSVHSVFTEEENNTSQENNIIALNNGVKGKRGRELTPLIKKGKYNCPVNCCTKSFQIKKLLKKHLEDSHSNGNPYQCRNCSEQFSDEIRIKKHNCVRKFKKSYLKSNIATDQNHHKSNSNSNNNKESFRESKYSSNYSSEEEDEDDDEDENEGETIMVESIPSTNKESLKKYEENLQIVKCDEEVEDDEEEGEDEDYSSSQENNENSHNEEEEKEEEEEDEEDEEEGKTKNEYIKQEKKIKKMETKKKISKPYSCNICHKGFTLQRRLENHQATHSTERCSQCDKCGKRFARKDKLMRHMFVHSEEKMFVCDICQKRFSRRDKLSDHLKSHGGTDEIHNCPMCQKQFLRPDILKQHVKLHGMGNKHQCSECLRFVTGKDRLEKHMARHQEAKALGQTLLCPLCTKYFIQRQSLKAHIKKFHPNAHIDIEPPQQPQNSASTSSVVKVDINSPRSSKSKIKSELSNHFWKNQSSESTSSSDNSKTKPFSCQECSRTFARKQALKKHLRKHFSQVIEKDDSRSRGGGESSETNTSPNPEPPSSTQASSLHGIGISLVSHTSASSSSTSCSTPPIIPAPAHTTPTPAHVPLSQQNGLEISSLSSSQPVHLSHHSHHHHHLLSHSHVHSNHPPIVHPQAHSQLAHSHQHGVTMQHLNMSINTPQSMCGSYVLAAYPPYTYQ